MTTSTPNGYRTQDGETIAHQDALPPSSNIFVVGQPTQSWEYFCTHTSDAVNGIGIAISGCDESFYTEKLTTAAFDVPLTKIGFLDGTEKGGQTEIPIPQLGKQLFDALDRTPCCDVLYITNLTALLEQSSVQSLYRLLYLLSKRVAATQTIALYSIADSVDPKTKRIIQQPMDYRVTFDETDVPSIQPLSSSHGTMNDGR